MVGGADTSIGQGNCIFVGLNVFRQLFNVVGRKVLVRNQSHRNVDDQADWLEIFKRIVPGVFIQRGCGGEARMHQQYRVAVSVGAGDLSDTDSAAGPAFIFDDDRLSQRGPLTAAANASLKAATDVAGATKSAGRARRSA